MTTVCARHPKTETALSCGRCDTPICPRCAVAGPVGFRCPECASVRSSPLYRIHPARLALAGLVAAACGAIVGLVLQEGGGFLFFLFFLTSLLGGLVGEIILRATGRKRGPTLEWLTGISFVSGADLSLLFTGAWHSPTALAWLALGTGLSCAAAIAKIRR